MKRTVALLTCLALMIPGAAVASANATNSTYGPPPGIHNITKSRCGTSMNGGSGGSSSGSGSTSGSSGSSSSTGTNCATETTSVGNLPFTGLDLAALAVGGVVLLGAGLVLRRVSATGTR
jgi:hypothetical protein